MQKEHETGGVYAANEVRIDERNLAEAFVQQVQRAPDATAVVFQGTSVTFGELNHQADWIANQLVADGIGPESIVALYCERSLEMIIVLLAIWKAGGAYLPIDPNAPLERILLILEESQAALLLTTATLAARHSAPLPNVRLIEALQTNTRRGTAETYQGNSAGPESLAYILYTSGSTGIPKGVMVTQGSVLNLAAALEQSIYTGHNATRLRVGLNAPLAFDASVKQIVQLLHGRCLVLVPEECRRDPWALLQLLTTEQIDVIDCTPGLLKPLIRAGLLDQFPFTGPAVLVGGEAIDHDLWWLLRQHGGCDFYNLYGPTECTVDTATCNIRDSGTIPTIGKPLANTRIYILDEFLRQAPAGEAGEIYIGGAGIARGYLNRPLWTQERFLDDPFVPGERLYRTGDRARFLPDGNIEFLGRLDNQVKLRGYRIELEEIEAVLKQHPAIADAVVICQTDTFQEQTLVAYVEPKPSFAPHNEDLGGFLKRKLPDYMIPTAFMQMAALPLTAHGKVDRVALATLQASRLNPVKTYVAPRNEVEEALAEMWSQLLGIESIGIHDDFFELGGHSLLALQLIGQLQALFPTDVPLLTLFFAQPTIAGTAEAISTSSAGQKGMETMVQLLHDLANLSEEEVDQMLYGQTLFDPVDEDAIDG